MKELGEYLKEVRLNNSVELEEASSDLEMDINELESIEEGNIRAFKDILSLKEKVKSYAKYLGLDPNKVIDEFNDFLFEHTSKINLNDILEAEKVKSEKKVSSPYTRIKVRKVNKKILLEFMGMFLFVILLVLLIFYFMRPKARPMDMELLSKTTRSGVYEFTY